jgi:hemin uptake protein HemP
MMKKIYFIAAAAFGMIISGTAIVNSNSAGGPAGRTGSPGDNGVTCAQGCHSGGTVTSQTTDIQITQGGSPVTEWDLGAIYDVVVSVNDGGAAAQRYGFSLTVEDDNDDPTGTLISPDNQTQINGIGGSHITHTFSSATPSAPGSQTWSFQWQAPNSGVNDVTFYAVGLCANGNGTNGGDVVVPANSVTLSRAPMSLSEGEVITRVFPNPASDWLTIESNQSNIETFELYNTKGQKVESGELIGGENTIDVSHLPKGQYIIRIGASAKQIVLL